MKLTKLEKWPVNRMAKRNIKAVEQLFSQVDLGNVEKVLEVGCGIGVVSSCLAEEYGWDVAGIDLDPDQIKRAKNSNIENKGLKFLEADATRLPFKNDMVLSFDALHPIPNWDKALEEISRVLKSEGFYVLNDLAFPSLKIFRGLLKKYMSIFAAEDITRCLERNNFVIVYGKKKIGGRFSVASQRSK
ncbi:MAG: class I SAM-dependent methyltransferase [Candidatus Altiarchaeota archaeon]|nr:class I SAM-dependent methyltransferase [Candidatus Altiarchaeota archaeon]